MSTNIIPFYFTIFMIAFNFVLIVFTTIYISFSLYGLAKIKEKTEEEEILATFLCFPTNYLIIIGLLAILYSLPLLIEKVML